MIADRLARLSLLALPFAAGLACSPRLTLEQFELPKHAALCLLAPGLLAGGAAGLVAAAPALIGLAAVACVSALGSPNPAAAWLGEHENLEGVLTWALYAVCALAGAGAGAVTRRAFRLAILVAAAGAAGYALAQAAGLDPFPGEAFRHVRAFAGNPDFLAQQMAMALPVAAASVLAATGSRRVAAAALAAALGLALGLTACRGGAAAAVVGLAVAGRLLRGRARPAAMLAVAALAVAAGAAAEARLPAGLGLRARLAQLATGEGFTRARGRLWTGAARAAAERPVLGWGPEGLRAVFLRVVPAGWADAEGPGITARNAHAWPLQVAATLGLPGLAAWGWLLVVVARGARAAETDPGLAGAAAAFLAHNLVSFGTAATAPVWWAIAGMLAIPPAPTPAAGGRRWAAGLAGAAALLAAVRLVADGYGYRGNESSRAGHQPAAAASFRSAARLAPWEGAYFARAGIALEAAGRPDLALPAFERAAALAPLDGLRAGHVARVRFALATAERRRDEQREAYALLTRAIDLAPSQPSLYGAAIMAAQALGRRDETARLAAALRAREPAWAARMLGPAVSSP